MDDFAVILVLIFTLAAAGAGVVRTVLDFRYFGTIARECTERGYIQDDSKRIICSPEVAR